MKTISSDLKMMTDSIAHRGPDGEGHWFDASQGIGLGHRRLSIIELSDLGHQPMHLEERYVITFNGEIYNFIELRKELEYKGYSFKTKSDTEVLLVAFHEWGGDCLQKLDGMFAFAIFDKTEATLFCARDRFGEKPFYYSYNKEKFAFGSEMKALFSINIPKIVDEEMVFQYLNDDVVENPHNKTQTFYKNITQLPASTYFKFKLGDEITHRKYWSIDTKKIIDISEKDATKRFQELFDSSIKMRMRSDVKVGCSLSGGVDSSSILCSILNLFPTSEFNTFTARFNDKNFDEGVFIDQLEERYDFKRDNCYPNPDQIQDELDKIFFHQEEPFGSTSIIAQWEVMKLAKSKNVPVLLDGQGADETIGGYFKYFNPFLHELYQKDKRNFKLQLDSIEKHLGVNSFFNKKELIRLKSPFLYDTLNDFSRKYRRTKNTEFNPEFSNQFKNLKTPFHRDTNLNDFLSNDIFSYGLSKLLRFSDRNAMAHGVEVRLPFLSHELVEFVFSLPLKYKINNGWTKNILRRSMENRVPKEILYRKDKKGFQAPSSWLEKPGVVSIIQDSQDFLIHNKIIKKPKKENAWKYIMTAKLYSDA